MTFTAEVLLKGHDEAVDEVIHRDGPEPGTGRMMMFARSSG